MYDILTFFRELDRHVVTMDMMRWPKQWSTLSEYFIDMFSSIVGEELWVITFYYLFRSIEKDCFEYKLEKDERKYMDSLWKIWTIENSDWWFLFSYDFSDNVLEDDITFIDFVCILNLIDDSKINIGLWEIDIDD